MPTVARFILAASGVVCGIVCADSVSAAPNTAEDAERLSEIVVSARKREERLQDVPASVAAASGAMLADQNITSVTKLDAIAPGLTFATNPSRFGSGPAIAIRGITTQTQSNGVQDSVGIVVDGVVIARAKAGAFPDLSDVERVEVMRGPQGTLFGKNASAGLISVVTKDPTSEFVSDLSVGYSTYDDAAVRGSISGPIVDEQLLGRFSAFNKSRDGYVKNIFDGRKFEDDSQKGVRGKLLYKPSEDDRVKLSADFIDEKNDGGAAVPRQFRASTPAYVVANLSSIIGLENDEINAQSFGRNRHRTGGAALEWEHALGEFTFTSVSAYRKFNQDFATGTYSWLTPLDSGAATGYTHLKQYSQELRIESPTKGLFDYVAGLYFMNDVVKTRITNQAVPVIATGTTFGRDYISDVDTDNYAAFGEVSANLNDHFKLTAGARQTHEKVDLSIVGLPALGQTRTGHPVGTTTDSMSANNFSWRLGAQWNFDADRMLYTSYSTGYKGPGFNVNTSVLGDAQPLRPEIAKNYEVGLRSQFLDRRVTANLTVFHTQLDDFQTQGGFNVPGQPLARVILLNAGSLRSQGVEGEFHVFPVEGSEIGLNLSYIDAEFTDFTNAPCNSAQTRGVGRCTAAGTQNLNGFPLPNTPKWSFSTFLKQEFSVSVSGWRGFGAVDYSWRDEVQWNTVQDPMGIEGSYGLLGASFGLRNERATVKLYGKNLTNEFHTAGIVVGDPVTHLLPPDYQRIFGVEATFNF